ncbi:nitrilase-related carbon-nitrogen hydrolase [Bradyrhizobium betae]
MLADGFADLRTVGQPRWRGWRRTAGADSTGGGGRVAGTGAGTGTGIRSSHANQSGSRSTRQPARPGGEPCSAERWILAAADDGAKLIVTPEYSDVRGGAQTLRAAASPVPGEVTGRIAALAQRTGCWIHLGSMHERLAGQARLGNSGIASAPDGTIAARYRKVHLYDAVVDGIPIGSQPTSRPANTCRPSRR